MIWLLNVYWYRLILKGLIRLLEENGILGKSKDDNRYKDLDVHEAAQIGVHGNDRQKSD